MRTNNGDPKVAATPTESATDSLHSVVDGDRDAWRDRINAQRATPMTPAIEDACWALASPAKEDAPAPKAVHKAAGGKAGNGSLVDIVRLILERLPDRNEYFRQSEEGRSIFVPTLLGRDLAQVIIPRVGPDGWIYRYDDGVYLQDGEHIIKATAQALLEGYSSTGRIREGAEWVRTGARVNPLSFDPNPDRHVVRIGNGILDVLDGSLEKYTPANASLTKLPWDLVDGAVCPEIDRFLLEVMLGDEKMVEYLLELIGYCCLERNPLRRAVLLFGTGNNGKSILLWLLGCLLGVDNYTTIPFARLGGDDRFTTSTLVGKLANICGDIGSQAPKDVSVFMQWTGQDAFYAERKGRDGFSFRSGALPIFSANEHPRSPNVTSAFFGRWEVVPFDAKFKEDAAVENRLKALGQNRAEMEGLLRKAMDAVTRLLERGDFDRPEKVVRAKSMFRQSIDSVSAWLSDNEEGPIVDDGGKESKTSVFIHYKDWCDSNNLKPLGRNKFYDRLLSAETRITSSGDNGRLFANIKLPPPQSPSLSDLFHHSD